MPGVPGRFLFFLAGGCCWEVELLLLAPEGPELEPWRGFCSCCCCFSWTTSSPVFPEEKLPSSPVAFDIWKRIKDWYSYYRYLSFCSSCFLFLSKLLFFLSSFLVVGALTKRKGMFFGEHKIGNLLSWEEDKNQGILLHFRRRRELFAAITLTLEPGLLWPYINIYSMHKRQLLRNCP